VAYNSKRWGANECDLVDIKFVLEYVLRTTPGLQTSELYGLAITFANGRSVSREESSRKIHEDDTELERAYNTYRAQHPRSSPPRSSPSHTRKARWATNPQIYKDQIAAELKLPTPDEGWDSITLNCDPYRPDLVPGGVTGRITPSIGTFLDVWLSDFPNALSGAGERRILVKRAAYLMQRRSSKRSARSIPNNEGEPPKSLMGCGKKNIIIWNYSYEKQEYVDQRQKA
jgi:hypothetical protein